MTNLCHVLLIVVLVGGHHREWNGTQSRHIGSREIRTLVGGQETIHTELLTAMVIFAGVLKVHSRETPSFAINMVGLIARNGRYITKPKRFQGA